jgi:hypothetical protein
MLHRRRALAAACRVLTGVAAAAPSSAVRGLNERTLSDVYYQEAYEALARHRGSRTYPGSLKVATPGDTKCYFEGPEVMTHSPDHRAYWRAVVDDAEVRALLMVRVRFKENVFVAPKWETRMHVIAVSVSPDATVDEVMAEVHKTNVHAFVGRTPFTLAHKGKAIDGDTTLVSLVPNGLRLLERGLTLDAIETAADHLWHRPETRPGDWDSRDVSATGEELVPPLVDLKPFATYTDLSGEASGERGMPSKPPVDMGHIK